MTEKARRSIFPRFTAELAVQRYLTAVRDAGYDL
jgi:hypothetical protein